MGTNFEPDGWSMVVGTWGTDADQTTTITKSGPSALHLKNTSVATEMIGPYFPIMADEGFSFQCLVRADSIAAGNTVTVGIKAYDESKSYLGYGDMINGVLNAANTWEIKSAEIALPSTYRYGRFYIKKPANAFNVYIDYVDARHLPACFGVEGVDASYLSINSATETDVRFNASLSEFIGFTEGKIYPTTDGSSKTMYITNVGGPVIISACVTLDALGDGKQMAIRIKRNSTFERGALMSPMGAAGYCSAYISDVFFAAPGDTWKIAVYHNHGSARNLITDARYNHFTMSYLYT